jgi:hypothetical protein
METRRRRVQFNSLDGLNSRQAVSFVSHKHAIRLDSFQPDGISVCKNACALLSRRHLGGRLRRSAVRAKPLVDYDLVVCCLLLAELVINTGEDRMRFSVRRVQTSRFAKLNNCIIQLAEIFKNRAELEMRQN